MRAVRYLSVAVVCLALAGCWGSSSGDGGTTGSGPGSASSTVVDRSVTVGSVDTTEMKLVARLYGRVLEKAGYQVSYRTVSSRGDGENQLAAGSLDVMPDYAATAAEELNQVANGASAPLVASSSPPKTVAALNKLLADRGLVALTPAAAANQNGFAMLASAARKQKVTTLSQLAATRVPVTLAAGAQCSQRPFCAPGLKRVYGITVAKVLPLGFGSSEAKLAVTGGSADLVLVATTDGTLKQYRLTLLADDRGLQLADNVVPIVPSSRASDAGLVSALNQVSAALTTAALADLNEAVDGERREPAGVAKAWLKSADLL
jgi:osmoprotectant transport system substrate-binding protein